HGSADATGGAGPVLDDARLAENVGEMLRQQAGDEIGAAARRKRHDDADRLRRILRLGAGAEWPQQARRAARGDATENPAPCGHAVTSARNFKACCAQTSGSTAAM